MPVFSFFYFVAHFAFCLFAPRKRKKMQASEKKEKRPFSFFIFDISENLKYH